jgi:hypothetical protein
LILKDKYYSPDELKELTDGELLDLVYYILENFKGPAYHSLDVIRELLTLSKTN